jgi:hypothetical protein
MGPFYGNQAHQRTSMKTRGTRMLLNQKPGQKQHSMLQLRPHPPKVHHPKYLEMLREEDFASRGYLWRKVLWRKLAILLARKNFD